MIKGSFLYMLQPNKKKLSLRINIKLIKMKRLTLIFIYLFFAIFIGYSKNVPLEFAKTVADNFYFQHSSLEKEDIKFNDAKIIKENNINYYYIFNLKNKKGFIIISADDAYYPIIGYSLTSNFHTASQPNNVKTWMVNYIEQINYLRDHKIVASPKISAMWDKYNVPLSKLSNSKSEKAIVVDALTGDITWNQSPGWNEYCPAGTPTGCVATAMSIIMKYYEYPIHGTGSSTYIDNGYWSDYVTGTHSVNYGESTYFWNLMPKNTSSIFSAKLCYNAGVSVEMDYAPEGSGSSSFDVPDALRDHFNYTCDNYRYKYSDEAAWISALKSQLDGSMPIYYSGRDDDNGGHAFVCDGYDDSDNFHFNFGWGGSNNGFYSLADVGGFHNNQGAILNIIPGDNSYPNKPTNVIATLVPETTNDFNVDVTWDAPVTRGVVNYLVYRDFDEIAEVSASTFNFTDVSPIPGNYYYSVVAKYADAKESLSESDFMKGTFNIVFHAFDPDNNNQVYTANISFNDEELPTTFVGATFSDVPYGVREFTITHPDYTTTSGAVNVNSDKTVNVVLNGVYTSINISNEDIVNVFPNPVKDVLIVNYKSFSHFVDYEIINISGQVVDKGVIDTQTKHINIDDLDKGYYFIKLYDKSMLVKSFIKE